ncbi:tumor necrosis factor receptor superfamily member 14-like isoform X2 [Synchiropus splendidus]|uniref:tumor necrosis factor receptor superfamily member 14-like isoform X2 n=1 Tax=Synchiropus splendidus TaxID=270530 RepID=UPI00237E112D|nr:tumor necrosis factor receptor superfamily member 14-like isoform X2 [Synchiropus splendidus]
MACGIWLLVFICFKLCVLLVGTPPSCPSGQYVVPTDDGDKCCQMCRPGNRTKPECTALQSTFCAVCGDGTYMDKYTARKQCHQCLNCTKGTGLRRIRSCKFDRNTMCEPLEGFLCVRGSVDRCVAAQQHSTCAPGQYISTAGTSSTDTVCGDCREGTFSDGTFMSCQNHTQRFDSSRVDWACYRDSTPTDALMCIGDPDKETQMSESAPNSHSSR